MSAPATQTEPLYATQDRCPACGGGEYDRVGPAAPGHEVEVGGRVFRQPPFDTRRCRRCHLMFKSAIAHPEVLADYYRRVDPVRWETPGLYPSERPVVALLRDLPRGSRVLDFGCSTGRLLSRVTDRHQCFGIEINPDAARTAASVGITVLPTDELKRNDPGPGFDAICAMDVFEHLTQPLTVLRALSDRLRPGGLLVVCTGDSDTPATRGEPALFWYFELIEHVCVLNQRHAEYVAVELGLDLVRADRVCHYDMPWSLRLKQRLHALAYEAFHRNRRPWLRAMFGLIPKFRNARRWSARPIWNSSPDHLLLVFRKR